MKKYFLLTFSITLAISILLGVLSDYVFRLNQELTLLITLLPIIIYCAIYCMLFFTFGRRIKQLYENHEYDAAILLIKKLNNWYYAGKGNSAFHMMVSVIYFTKEDDLNFLEESELITASKYLWGKYYWRTIYFIIYHNEVNAKEQFNLLNIDGNAMKHTAEIKRLELLFEVMESRGTDKLKAIDRALQEFQNERVCKFLSLQKTIL